MLETETSWLTKTLPEALKTAKEYAYAVENLFATKELGSKVIKWERASPDTISHFIAEIERVYKLCRDKATTTTETEENKEDSNQILPSDILPALHFALQELEVSPRKQV